MSFAKTIGSLAAVCLALAQAAGATTILQSSGNSAASEPLGYYAPYAPYGLTPAVFAVEWSQTSTYTNVDVYANLFTPGSLGTVDYALVTAIGPGTTFAADGVVRGSAVTPINPTNVQLFQLSSLGPGTYYLVLDSPVANTSWQYNYPLQRSYTAAPGASFLGDDVSYGGSIDSGYTPGSNFHGATLPVEFSVTGTTPTPEPSGFLLLGTGLLCVAATIGKKRRA